MRDCKKARKPSPIPVIGAGSFEVDDKKVDGPEIDPSFTSAHGRPTDVGTSATVGLVKRPETNRLDYQVRMIFFKTFIKSSQENSS